MQKRSVLLSTTFAVIVMVLCISAGITKSSITKAIKQTSNAVNKLGIQRVNSLHKLVTSPQNTKKVDAFNDRVFDVTPSETIKNIKLPSGKLTRSANFQQKLDKLLAKVQKRGTVPVIVTLQVAYQSETKLDNDLDRQAQRRLISDLRQSLLSSLKHNPASLKTYDITLTRTVKIKTSP